MNRFTFILDILSEFRNMSSKDRCLAKELALYSISNYESKKHQFFGFVPRLRADKTAAGAGEGLVDLTIGGLWWLRESMVTLGGMVELVTLLTTHSPPAYPQETPVIQAMSALHDVFASLHVSILYPYYSLQYLALKVYYCLI